MSNIWDKLLDALGEALDRGESRAKRTCCCNVPMFDMWMHAETCPNFQAALAYVRANGGKSRPRRAGDTSGMCPTCGYPTGYYGIYTVGKKCEWCGDVEKVEVKV